MAKSENKFKISIADGTFEVSGSKKFVKQQIKDFRDVIDEMLDTAIFAYDDTTLDDYEELDEDYFLYDDEDDFDDDFDDDDEFYDVFEGAIPDIYSVKDQDIIISGDIPGDTNSAKTVNAALLFAYAKFLSGEDKVTVDGVREICDKQGFLDGKNFSTYIKSGAPKLYSDSGKGDKRKLEITKKGVKKAEKLISEITVQ